MDGTFLKARFILTLLLAVGIDANGELILLAWAVVESENRNSWEWFFRHLRRAIPEISSEECTLISDRDKGLIEAEVVLGGRVVVAWCCHHLKENFTERFGRAMAPLFWQVARARSQAAYDKATEEIRGRKVEAATYLAAQDPSKWVEFLFRGRRYGHDTSNIVESLNQVLRFDRELPIVELLDALWHRVMEKRAERLGIASLVVEAGGLTTPWVEGKLEEGRALARSNRVQPSSPTEGRVVQPDGRIFLVDLAAGTCSCRRYQENGVPCGHAMSLIFAIGASVGSYLPAVLSAAQWAATYTTPLVPIDISSLETLADEICEPPVTRVPRGRPKKERVRREDMRCPRGRRLLRERGVEAVWHRCGTCGEASHNARTCRRPHQ